MKGSNQVQTAFSKSTAKPREIAASDWDTKIQDAHLGQIAKNSNELLQAQPKAIPSSSSNSFLAMDAFGRSAKTEGSSPK
jgi:hypothetical protein